MLTSVIVVKITYHLLSFPFLLIPAPLADVACVASLIMRLGDEKRLWSTDLY